MMAATRGDLRRHMAWTIAAYGPESHGETRRERAESRSLFSDRR
jgi:hypothetical protein